jgi:hypothetical protein
MSFLQCRLVLSPSLKVLIPDITMLPPNSRNGLLDEPLTATLDSTEAFLELEPY